MFVIDVADRRRLYDASPTVRPLDPTRRRALFIVASLLILATCSRAVRAAAYEGFDYPVGAMGDNLNGGSGFAQPWRVSPSPRPSVVAGSLSDPSGTLLTSGNHVGSTDFSIVRRLGQSPSQVGGEFWVSFLMRRNGDAELVYSGLFMQTGGQFGQYYVGEPAFGHGEDFLVIGNGTDQTASVSGVPFEIGRTYFLVARIQLGEGNDPGTLWVNPTPGVMPTAGGTRFTLSNFGEDLPTVHLLLSGNYTASAEFDELRTGSSYADVAPVAPEPQALGVIGVVLLVALGRRPAHTV